MKKTALLCLALLSCVSAQAGQHNINRYPRISFPSDANWQPANLLKQRYIVDLMYPHISEVNRQQLVGSRSHSNALKSMAGELTCLWWRYANRKPEAPSCFSAPSHQLNGGDERPEQTPFYAKYGQFAEQDMSFWYPQGIKKRLATNQFNLRVRAGSIKTADSLHYPIRQQSNSMGNNIRGSLIVQIIETIYRTESGQIGQKLHKDSNAIYIRLPTQREIAQAKTAKQAWQLGYKQVAFIPAPTQLHSQ